MQCKYDTQTFTYYARFTRPLRRYATFVVPSIRLPDQQIAVGNLICWNTHNSF